MNWLRANINHLTVPLGMLLSLMTVVFGLIAQKKRKEGAPRPYISEGMKNSLIVVLLVCAVLLGIALAKNV
jgi:hypothetical protein